MSQSSPFAYFFARWGTETEGGSLLALAVAGVRVIEK